MKRWRKHKVISLIERSQMQRAKDCTNPTPWYSRKRQNCDRDLKIPQWWALVIIQLAKCLPCKQKGLRTISPTHKGISGCGGTGSEWGSRECRSLGLSGQPQPPKLAGSRRMKDPVSNKQMNKTRWMAPEEWDGDGPLVPTCTHMRVYMHMHVHAPAGMGRVGRRSTGNDCLGWCNYSLKLQWGK